MLYVRGYVIPRHKNGKGGNEEIRFSTEDWRDGSLNEDNHKNYKRVWPTVIKQLIAVLLGLKGGGVKFRAIIL